MRTDVIYCDNCGEALSDDTTYVVSCLIYPVDSANAGESAVLCNACHAGYTDKVVSSARDRIRAAFIDEQTSRWPDGDILFALANADMLLASLLNSDPILTAPDPDIEE